MNVILLASVQADLVSGFRFQAMAAPDDAELAAAICKDVNDDVWRHWDGYLAAHLLAVEDLKAWGEAHGLGFVDMLDAPEVAE